MAKQRYAKNKNKNGNVVEAGRKKDEQLFGAAWYFLRTSEDSGETWPS